MALNVRLMARVAKKSSISWIYTSWCKYRVTMPTETIRRTGEHRNKPEGIAEAVAKGGRIKLETAAEVLRLVAEKTEYVAWIAIEVQTPMLLKTIDNEDDALETIRRLKEAPGAKKTKG